MLTLNKRLRHDPTRTTDIRHSYNKDVMLRLNKIRRLVKEAIIGKEAFRFDSTLLANINVPSRIGGEGDTPEELSKAFTNWLGHVEDEILLEVTRDGNGNINSRNPWQNDHIQMTYIRAIKQSELMMKAQGIDVGSRSIRQLLNDPFHRQALVNLFNVNFEAFQTVIDFGNAQIVDKIRQEIIAGYAETRTVISKAGFPYSAGPTRRQISKKVFEAFDDRFSKIIKTRSEMIVRTEIIRAHAEASLNSFEERHIGRAAALVEFATAMDDRVCSICMGLEGKIFSVAEARGMIPRHPRCRCVWIPVVDVKMANKLIQNWYRQGGYAIA